MVDAKEIRIGNIFEGGVVEGVGPVDSHGYVIEVQIKGSFPREPEELNPIPITPELLEKCGFFKFKFSRHDADVYCSEDFNFPASFHFSSAHPNGLFSFIGVAFEHIKYLHQLQNAHHAMTGKELEVSL